MFIENIIDYLPFLSKRIFSELEEIRWLTKIHLAKVVD
jgi:hypothetical protein